MQLKGLIEAYHCTAAVAYQKNPEAMSLMVLTIMDLWVACDKAACRVYDPLKKYDNGVDGSLLCCLLLPLKSELNRIANIESYLQHRSAGINKTFVSPYRGFGHWNSFGVKYFDQSPPHQQLLAKIEAKANQQKLYKIQELAELNQAHQDLMRRHESCSCTNIEVTHYDINQTPYVETEHSPNCQ